jgi:hypothetical protein
MLVRWFAHKQQSPYTYSSFSFRILTVIDFFFTCSLEPYNYDYMKCEILSKINYKLQKNVLCLQIFQISLGERLRVANSVFPPFQMIPV